MVRNIHQQTVVTGPGTATTNTTIDHNLSRAQALRLTLKLTAAATGAGDTLDIRLQETADGVTWNTRARFPQYLGTATVSATAPETYEMVIPALMSINNSEKGFEPSGSAGASEIAAGQVVTGPFKGWWYQTGPAQAGAHLHQAAYRINVAVVDANADGGFSFDLSVWADTPNMVVA